MNLLITLTFSVCIWVGLGFIERHLNKIDAALEELKKLLKQLTK